MAGPLFAAHIEAQCKHHGCDRASAAFWRPQSPGDPLGERLFLHISALPVAAAATALLLAFHPHLLATVVSHLRLEH